MTVRPPAAAAWRAEEAAADSGWILRLTPDEAEGFDQALRHARQADKPWLAMGPQDFPLPPASRGALQRAAELTQGRWGMCLLRGLPVDRWNEHEARLACWGIGLHMGVARTQNRASDFIADVRNEGGVYKGANGRGYNTNAGLDFHCDSADANMVEGGQTPIESADELGRRGFRIVIFPGGTARFVVRQLQRYFGSLRQHGSTAPMRGEMLDFDGINDVIGTPELLARAKGYEA